MVAPSSGWCIAYADKMLFQALTWADEQRVWAFLRFILPILDEWENSTATFVEFFLQEHTTDDLS